MGLLDRALNVGESKRFKEYEQRVALINAFEPELELDSDDELQERMDALRERARNGEPLDDLLPECFAIVRELSNAQLVTIRDSGHPVYVEQPESFRTALTAFLL